MRRTIIGILCCLTLAACTIAPDTVVMKDVDVSNWKESVSVEFNNDSEQVRNLSITLHVNSRFQAEQIALQVKMYSPDSLYHVEQVHLPCAVEWSQPTASSIDIELPYRQGVRLKCKGKYLFEITPLTSIAGVEAAGINFQANK